MAKETTISNAPLKPFDTSAVTADQLKMYRDLAGDKMPGANPEELKFSVTQSDFLNQLQPVSANDKEQKANPNAMEKTMEKKQAPAINKDSVGLVATDKPCVQCILSGKVAPKEGAVFVDASGREQTITEKDPAKALAALKSQYSKSAGVYSAVELLANKELLKEGTSFVNPTTGKIELITKELTDPAKFRASYPGLSKVSPTVTGAPSIYDILDKPEMLKAGSVYRDPSGSVRMIYSDVVKKDESLAYLKKHYGNQPKFERSADSALKDVPTVHELIENPGLIALGQRYLLPSGEVKIIVGSGTIDKQKAVESLSSTYVKTLPSVDDLLANKELVRPGVRYQNPTFSGGSSVIPVKGFDAEQALKALKAVKEHMNKPVEVPNPKEKSNKPTKDDGTVAPVAYKPVILSNSRFPFSPDQLDSVMRSYTKGKQQPPVSGEFIMKLCQEEGFDVSLFLAMAVHESNIGTNGSRSLSTKNMFNYGNDDAGRNNGQASWEEGCRMYVRKMKENYGATLEQAAADNFYHKDKIGYYCETYQGITGAAGAKAYTNAIIKTASAFRQKLGISSGGRGVLA
jgi:hypothetical protein